MAKYDLIVAQRQNLILLLEECWKILLQVSHRFMTSHLKFDKLLQFLKLQILWTLMAKDVKECIDKCSVCLKMSPYINIRPLKPVEAN